MSEKIKPQVVAMGTKNALEEPLAHITAMTDEEGLQFYINEGNRCQLDWSDVNNINSKAVDAVGTLMQMAGRGDDSAKHWLASLAVGITRHLHEHHSDLIPKSSEFPVVLSAGNEQRQEELEACKVLPIGSLVGFPHRPGKKPGASYDDSPAGFWREIQWWIDRIRSLALEYPNNTSVILDGGGTYKASLLLQQKIAALPDFGSGDKDAWFSVASELVAENPDDMIPQWICDRVLAGKDQRGLPFEWTQQLRKGLGYCWSRS